MRRLLLLNLLLAVVLALLVWQLRREREKAQAREQAFLRRTLHSVAAAPLAPLPKVAPLSASAYAGIADRNLFSRDRNPTVVIEPPPAPPPKPVPPLPSARGVMLWDGAPPTIVLSEKPGGPQKGYHPGEKIGEWTIVSIDNKYVILSWDGKEFQKRIDELLDRTPVQVAAAAPAPASPPGPARPANLGANARSGPGAEMGGGVKACVAGDSAPPGTIVDGMKKVVSESPFGSVCRWETAR